MLKISFTLTWTSDKLPSQGDVAIPFKRYKAHIAGDCTSGQRVRHLGFSCYIAVIHCIQLCPCDAIRADINTIGFDPAVSV